MASVSTGPRATSIRSRPWDWLNSRTCSAVASAKDAGINTRIPTGRGWARTTATRHAITRASSRPIQAFPVGGRIRWLKRMRPSKGLGCFLSFYFMG